MSLLAQRHNRLFKALIDKGQVRAFQPPTIRVALQRYGFDFLRQRGSVDDEIRMQICEVEQHDRARVLWLKAFKIAFNGAFDRVSNETLAEAYKKASGVSIKAHSVPPLLKRLNLDVLRDSLGVLLAKKPQPASAEKVALQVAIANGVGFINDITPLFNQYMREKFGYRGKPFSAASVRTKIESFGLEEERNRTMCGYLELQRAISTPKKKDT